MTMLSGNSTAQVDSMQHFAAWATFYSKAFAACGWKQSGDQGQMEWPATIVSISQVAVSGGNATYTYNATTMSGPPLTIGMPVSVVGFTTAGNNVSPNTFSSAWPVITALGGSGATSTFTVVATSQANETNPATGGIGRVVNVSQVAVSGAHAVYTYNATAPISGAPLHVGELINVNGFVNSGNNVLANLITAVGGSGATSTFTVGLSTQLNESHAATAVVNPNLYQSATVAPTIPTTPILFEIWQSTDALSSTCPITVRVDYGQSTSNTPKTWFTVGLGGTNGAGTLSTPSTTFGAHLLSTYGIDANLRNNYASGDAGNIRIGVNWGGNLASNPSLYFQFLCVSRSYDGTGNQTGQYVMLFAGSYNSTSQQALYPPSGGGGIAPPEFANWIALCGTTSNQSQGFAGNVAVSPVYCVVGGFSNPTPDLALGKNVDFTDATQVTVSFYNVNHNYIVCNPFNKSFNNSALNALLMRFE